MGTKENQKSPQGFQALAVATSAVAFTLPTHSAYYVLVRNEGSADVRWRDDGTNPTSTVGFLLKSGETLEYDGIAEKVKFICDGAGTSATLDCAYYL